MVKKNEKNNIIPKHIAKYAKQCIHDMYQLNC